jgi:hypothetical protein
LDDLHSIAKELFFRIDLIVFFSQLLGGLKKECVLYLAGRAQGEH